MLPIFVVVLVLFKTRSAKKKIVSFTISLFDSAVVRLALYPTQKAIDLNEINLDYDASSSAASYPREFMQQIRTKHFQQDVPVWSL